MLIESLHRTLRNVATGLCFVLASASSLPACAGQLASPHATSRAPTSIKDAGGIVSVVEYYNAGLKHYFITADLNEIAILDSGAFGGAWKRTGQEFPAWGLAGAPADTVPVCRFFGTDKYRADGTRIGPNSHFYDAVPDECEFVKTAWQSIAADGLSYPAWTFEKYAFAVKLRLPPQQGGDCPTGTTRLYRAYNNGLGGDPNHRYSTDGNLLGNMGGWATEGLVMCLPQVTGAGIPAQLIACYGTDCPDDGKINNGPDLVNLVVDITNPTASPIDFVVPAGQTFLSVTGLYQDGLSVERLQATIAPGTTRKIVLRMFCMQHARAIAPSGAIYTTGPVTGNAALLDLVSITNGKLDVGQDPLTLKRGTVQFAVWVITDLTGSLSALQRSLLVQLMAAAPEDVDTQVMLAAEFTATVPGF